MSLPGNKMGVSGKIYGHAGVLNFAMQSFPGSRVDFRGTNVNNSEAYLVARAWKTDERTFPSRGCKAIGSSFRMRRVFMRYEPGADGNDGNC
jgi:hypothetical protein